MATIEMGDSGNCVDIIRQHFRSEQPSCGVEIGVYRGGLSAKLLDAFPKLILAMVDPWKASKPDDRYALSGDPCASQTAEQQADNRKAAELATNQFASRRVIFRLTSKVAAARLPWPKIEFAFIDGDHSYEGAKEDIGLWWPRIRSRGLLIGHDYGNEREGFGVTKAVDEFVEREGLVLELAGSCWWVVRP